MKFPAYGRLLWERRLLGQRPRVVALLIGDDWRRPRWVSAEIPLLAVKNAAWHEPGAPRFDWRLVVSCDVLAIDRRLPGERACCGEWDSWFWLLAEVQRFAADVVMYTPSESFNDRPDRLAPERVLEVYAWCSRRYERGVCRWPPWWPFENRIAERNNALRAAA